MRLYVANTTAQHQTVYYRTDFPADGRFSPPRQQPIAPGKQIVLGGDLPSMDTIEALVRQITRYGAVAASEAKNSKRVVPYVWNAEKPVPLAILQHVVRSNASLKIEEGRQRRQRAAVGMNEAVQKIVHEQFAAAAIPAEPTDRVEFGIEQEEQTEAGEKRIEEGFRVRRDGPPPKPTRAKRRGR